MTDLLTLDQPPVAAATEGRVLLVTERTRDSSLRHWLDEAGFLVAVAHTRAEAWGLADAFVPDVILSDVDVALPASVTAAASVRILDLELAAARHEWPPADGYLTLPVALEPVVTLVSSLIRLRRAEVKAASSDRLFDAYFRITGVGMTIVSLDGFVLRANEAMERLTGRSKGELVGEPLSAVVSPACWPQVRTHFADFMAGTDATFALETVAARADGTTFPCAVRGTLLRDPLDPASGVIVSKVEDLTERNEALEHLRRSDAAKTELLSRTSHELRTPLNAISGYAQLLADEKLSAQATGMVEQIVTASRGLADVIDDLLDLAGQDPETTGTAALAVMLAPLVAEVVSLLRPLSAGITVTIDTDGCAVLGDRTKLRKVLINLIGNAVKYNKAGGTVHVGATTDEGIVEVTVTDTGVGIAPEELARIFEPFERGSRGPRQAQGAGLGLAIVLSDLESMAGTISVQSRPDEGSTFTIRLPAAPAPATGDLANKPTILYVEDAEINARLMLQVFARYRPDLNLVVAPDGATGLQMIDELNPALVFLDYHLPDTTGLEILETTRASGNHVPTFILTADRSAALATTTLGAGADGVLTKPFEIQNILQLLTTRVPARDNVTT